MSVQMTFQWEMGCNLRNPAGLEVGWSLSSDVPWKLGTHTRREARPSSAAWPTLSADWLNQNLRPNLCHFSPLIWRFLRGYVGHVCKKLNSCFDLSHNYINCIQLYVQVVHGTLRLLGYKYDEVTRASWIWHLFAHKSHLITHARLDLLSPSKQSDQYGYRYGRYK